MQIAVVGGGINGVMTAWALARRGVVVDLYERDRLMGATSRATTKMLHGGLRYLEHGRFSLVREALRERAWWLRQAPQFARKFQLVLPVYRGARPRWWLGLGLALYDLLAAGSGFPPSRWLKADALRAFFPTLSVPGLIGGYVYWDGQMDDYKLGLWAAERAREAGVRIYEHTPVTTIAENGIVITDAPRQYDRVINAAGPWAEQLLIQSGLQSAYHLTLVRGSHLVVRRRIALGCVLQVPGEKRLVFLLPYGEAALLGTTEVPQAISDPIEPSSEEVEYLIGCYNAFFSDRLEFGDVTDSFAGLRAIVTRGQDYSRASREAVIERRGRLINVFGGKWTTSRALAEKVVRIALA
jgi:glycerol-3-phosphate dehydrogenase